MAEPPLKDISTKTGLSEPALRVLHASLVRGQGKQAQFDHPELGGMGQWMRGGMVMIGDMFNSKLAAQVTLACALLSDHAAEDVIGTHPDWWPANLGSAGMTAAQDDLEYAHFPATHRLAVRQAGVITIYDTADLGFRGIGAQSGKIVLHTEQGAVPLDKLRQV